MSEAFDIHESGQLRLTTTGEQTSLLPIPDHAIPASQGPCLSSEALRETTAEAVVGSGGRPTYRERREARAERLREWAAKRDAKAAESFERSHAIGEMIPFGQPILVGHHSERRHRRDIARITAAADAGLDHADKAESMANRANEIDAQLARAVYSDDPDAIERLEERVAELEAERARWKAYNVSCKRGTPDLSVLDERQRANVETITRVCPYQLGKRGEITYTNLSATIRQKTKRIAELKQRAAVIESGSRGHGRAMLSKYPGECPVCGETIERGAEIVYYRLTREALHASCV